MWCNEDHINKLATPTEVIEKTTQISITEVATRTL